MDITRSDPSILFFNSESILFKKAPGKCSQKIRSGITTARLTATAGAEVRLRNEALLRAQSMHLAASLFSLDEILVPPRLMVPPAPVIPGEAPPEEDIATLAVPYMPDWPEMAAMFQAPVISLAEVLEGGASVVIIGLPGSGKTIALADLASRMSRREPLPGKLEQLTPLFLHTSDFNLAAANPETPAETLIAAIKRNTALLTQARLREYLELALQEGRALLLLDGVDELPRSQIDEITSFLGNLKSKYPSLRMVVTASLEFYDGLVKLGCVPFAVAAWDTNLRTEFIHRRVGSGPDGPTVAPPLPPGGCKLPPNREGVRVVFAEAASAAAARGDPGSGAAPRRTSAR